MYSKYTKGDWNAICESCGRKVKSSELQQRWDGLYVCSKDWEPRQPQDFVRGIADIQVPPWTRPEPEDVFVPINYTRSTSDNVSIGEVILKYYGLLPNKYLSTYSDNSLDAQSLNTFALNYAQSTILGGDTVPLMDFLAQGIPEMLQDSPGMVEILSFSFSTVTALNGSPLNSIGFN